jgi:hypothetical protein
MDFDKLESRSIDVIGYLLKIDYYYCEVSQYLFSYFVS